jgi:hypothetical protein
MTIIHPKGLYLTEKGEKIQAGKLIKLNKSFALVLQKTWSKIYAEAG